MSSLCLFPRGKIVFCVFGEVEILMIGKSWWDNSLIRKFTSFNLPKCYRVVLGSSNFFYLSRCEFSLLSAYIRGTDMTRIFLYRLWYIEVTQLLTQIWCKVSLWQIWVEIVLTILDFVRISCSRFKIKFKEKVPSFSFGSRGPLILQKCCEFPSWV